MKSSSVNLYVRHEILPAMKRLGYRLWSGDNNVNIVAVRTPFKHPDVFDDWIFTFEMYEGRPRHCQAWRCTTDPGTKPLEDPINPKGTAVLAEQQEVGCYQIGRHKGYPALRQVKPLKVWRDRNHDHRPDIGGTWEHGIFYTNIHASDKDPFVDPRAWTPARKVGGWSAGCVVFADSYEYVCEWWPTIQRAAQAYGPNFTFTLLELPAPPWMVA